MDAWLKKFKNALVSGADTIGLDGDFGYQGTWSPRPQAPTPSQQQTARNIAQTAGIVQPPQAQAPRRPQLIQAPQSPQIRVNPITVAPPPTINPPQILNTARMMMQPAPLTVAELLAPRVQEYFAPSADKVRARDIVREVPGATKTVGTAIAQGTARIPGQVVLTGTEALGGQNRIALEDPNSLVGKAQRKVFGEGDVTSYPEMGREFLDMFQGFRGKEKLPEPTRNAVGIPLGLAVGALDVYMPGGKREVAEQLAKAMTESQVKSVLKKAGITLGDDEVKQIVTSTDARDIKGIIRPTLAQEAAKLRAEQQNTGKLEDFKVVEGKGDDGVTTWTTWSIVDQSGAPQAQRIAPDSGDPYAYADTRTSSKDDWLNEWYENYRQNQLMRNTERIEQLEAQMATTTKILEELPKKPVTSRQAIENLLRRPDIKQAERDALTKALAQQNGPKIDLAEFRDDVQRSLVPLTRVQTDKYADYGRDSDYIQGSGADNPTTNIYQGNLDPSPGAGVHFYDNRYFAHTRTDEIDDQRSFRYSWGTQNEEGKWVVRDREELAANGMYKVVESFDDRMTAAMRAEELNNSLPSLGTRRVLEMQSDLFQQSRINKADPERSSENEVLRELSYLVREGKPLTRANVLEATKDLRFDSESPAVREWIEYSIRRDEEAIANFGRFIAEKKAAIKREEELLAKAKEGLESTPESEIYTRSTYLDTIRAHEYWISDYKDDIARFEKNREKTRKTVAQKKRLMASLEKNPIKPAELTPEQQAQKVLYEANRVYRNTWPERIAREEIRRAVLDGKGKIQFPTGETASVIEQYITPGRGEGPGRDASIGDEFEWDGDYWTVAETDGEGVMAYRNNDLVWRQSADEFLEEQGTHYYSDAHYDIGTWDPITPDEVADDEEAIKTLVDWAENYMSYPQMITQLPDEAKLLLARKGRDEFDNVYNTELEHLGRAIAEDEYGTRSWRIVQNLNDQGDGRHYIDEGDMIVALDEEPRYIERDNGTDLSGFDPKTDLSPDQYRVYEFYEKDLPKFLKKNFPEMRRVVDEAGASWWEIPLKPEYGQTPTQAFGFVQIKIAIEVAKLQAALLASLELSQDDQGKPVIVGFHPERGAVVLGLLHGPQLAKLTKQMVKSSPKGVKVTGEAAPAINKANVTVSAPKPPAEARGNKTVKIDRPERKAARPGAQQLNTEKLDLNEEQKALITDMDASSVREVLSNKEITQIARGAGMDTRSWSVDRQAEEIARGFNLRRNIVKLTNELDELRASGASRETLEAKMGEVAEASRISREQGSKIGRELQARKLLANELDTPMQRVFKLLDLAGVDPAVYSKAAVDVDFSNGREVIRFYRSQVPAGFEDWLDLVRYNSMLSSPLTQIINLSSSVPNSSVVAAVEKEIAGGLDAIRSLYTGAPRTRRMGEGVVHIGGYAKGIPEGIRAFKEAYTGASLIDNPDYTGKSSHIPVAAVGDSKMVDTLSFPTRVLEGADKFLSALTKNGELASLRYRQKGGIKVRNAEAEASQQAEYRIFRGEIGDKSQGHVLRAIDSVTAAIQGLRGNANPVVRYPAKFTLPFVRTLLNIVKQGIEYSPAGIVTLPGAQNKTNQVAKMIMGITVVGGAGTLLGAERLTWSEPTDPKKRAAFKAAGKQAYSVKFGGVWHDISKLPPVLAANLAFVAALDDAQKNSGLSDDGIDHLVTAMMMSGKFSSDQSYAKQIGTFIKAVQGDEEAAQQLIGNYPQQLVPYRALTGWFARMTDDTMRKINTDASFAAKQFELLKLNYPGLRQTVGARTTEDGMPIPAEHPIINAFSPIRIASENPERLAEYEAMEEKTRQNRLAREAKEAFRRDGEAYDGPDLFDVPEGLDRKYVDVLNQYEAMDSDARKEWRKDPKNAYALAEAEYEKKKASGELTGVELYKAEDRLERDRVESDFSADVVSFYGMSKTDMREYLEQNPDQQALYEQALALDEALIAAGVISRGKLRYGLADASRTGRRSGGRKSSGRKGGSSKKSGGGVTIGKIDDVKIENIAASAAKKIKIAKAPRLSKFKSAAAKSVKKKNIRIRIAQKKPSGA